MQNSRSPDGGLDLVVSVDEPATRIEEGADIDPAASIGPGSFVGRDCQISEFARIGPGCELERGVYIGPGVIVGKNCTIQTHTLVYEPALIEDGVFVGPGVVFTNDAFPRAVNPDGTRKRESEGHAIGVTVRSGASIGARAVCVAPITIGRWALVAAGAVVTRSVHDYAIVAGLPARQTGWVGRAGVPLQELEDGSYLCPATGEAYRTNAGSLSLVTKVA